MIVRDTLPGQTVFVSCAATNGGRCGGSAGAKSVTFNRLDSGRSAQITFVARVAPGVAAGSIITNVARVASNRPPDPSLANNVATASVTTADPGSDPLPEPGPSPDSSRSLDVVLILTDDQAWHTLQHMPLTNALIADAGVRFTNGFASTPVCCPSRVSTLTGLYSHNHNVLTNAPPLGGASRFDDSSSLATWLQSAGYRTGIFGKYMNGYQDLVPWPYVAPGWSEWHVATGYFGYPIVENGVERTITGKTADSYAVNFLARKAVMFIEETPAGQPLFLYFTPFAPHEPATPSPEDAGAFASLPPFRSPSFNEADVSDKPAWVRALPLLTQAEQDSTDALYRRQVETLQAVDRAVNSIVQALARTGRLEKSAIVFTSDNGWSQGAHRWGQKACVYEECVRVPFLVRAPGVAPRTDAGLVLLLDLAPTVAEWAGVTPPAPVNGRSFASLLRNPDAPWRDAVLLEFLGESPARRFQGVRTAGFLYAEYANGDRELYDLGADPHQLQNVVQDPSYGATLEQLKATLEALKLE